MGWVGHVNFMGDMRNEHKILVRKPVEKRCGIPSHRWNPKKTNFMEQGAFSEADIIQEIPCLLWNMEVH
jgi:hypothetical protein